MEYFFFLDETLMEYLVLTYIINGIWLSKSNMIKHVTPQIREGIMHETTIQYEKHVKDFYIFYHSFLSIK